MLIGRFVYRVTSSVAEKYKHGFSKVHIAYLRGVDDVGNERVENSSRDVVYVVEYRDPQKIEE